MKTYYVYILASKSRTLYTGVTNNLERRVVEHRRKLVPGFTARYNINRLVCYEGGGNIEAMIAREKQIKAWGRMKKIALIESVNRDWKDLSDGWPGRLLSLVARHSPVIPNAVRNPALKSSQLRTERDSSAIMRPRNDRRGEQRV
jgi:putative endonuclease